MKKSLYLLAILFSLSSTFAQIGEKVYYTSPIYLDFDIHYQNYKMNDTSLTLFCLPVNIMVPITNQLSVSISNIPYQITHKYDNSSYNLKNISDTKVLIKYIFLDKKALVNLFLNLPSGKTKIDIDEFDILTNLSMSILKYKIITLGEGFNIGLGFNYALPLNKNSTIALGISYNSKSEYEPVNYERIDKSLQLKYKPSDELGINFNYFQKITKNINFSLDLLYTTFNKSKINNNDIFQPGDIISSIIYFWINSDDINHSFLLNLRKINNNELKENGNWIKYENSMRIEADYKVEFNTFSNIIIYPILQYRNYGKYLDNWNGVITNINSSNILSFGIGTRIPITDLLNLKFTTKYNFGKIEIDKVNNIKGIEAFLNINVAY
ncbi:MAG TPA: hypothetical protein PKW14_07640 [Bacteroidota bacterium]|mgnify:FL=1|nr:hypothetical protein [Bacteroidota bacterium]